MGLKRDDKPPISETDIGKNWISQFAIPDRIFAEQLLNSILIVDNATFIDGLTSVLSEFLNNHEGTIAIYPVRERTKSINGKLNIKIPYFANQIDRPLSVDGHKNIGSEGEISHLCRDFQQKWPDRILNCPGINQMRLRKCRWIFCIDDLIGSGYRIDSFINWIHEDPHIRSWKSFRFIQIGVVVYAATEHGKKKINNNRWVTEIHEHLSLPRGSSLWSKTERTNIERICKEYAQYTSHPKWPIGFNDAFSLIVFPHSCPNTNPAILKYSKKNSWDAIFSHRPEFCLQWQVPNHLKRQNKLLTMLGHTRLIKYSLFSKLNSDSKSLFILLAAIASKRRHINVLGQVLGLPIPKINSMLEKCRQLGWIDAFNFISQGGKKALLAAKRNLVLYEEPPLLKNDFYFPLKMRSPGKPSSSSFLNKGGRLG